MRDFGVRLFHSYNEGYHMERRIDTSFYWEGERAEAVDAMLVALWRLRAFSSLLGARLKEVRP